MKKQKYKLCGCRDFSSIKLGFFCCKSIITHLYFRHVSAPFCLWFDFLCLQKIIILFNEKSCSDLKDGSPAVSSPLEIEIILEVCWQGVIVLLLLHWLSLDERDTKV